MSGMMSITTQVQAYFSALERQDGVAWVALFASDASLGGPAHTPPVVGQAALGELFAGIAALFETLHFDIAALHVHGPFAVAEFNLDARARNGRTAHADGMVAFAAGADGRFLQVAGFWDPAPVFAVALAEA